MLHSVSWSQATVYLTKKIFGRILGISLNYHLDLKMYVYFYIFKIAVYLFKEIVNSLGASSTSVVLKL